MSAVTQGKNSTRPARTTLMTRPALIARTTRLARLAAAAALALVAVALPARSAHADGPLTSVTFYLITNGAPAGGGPFSLTGQLASLSSFATSSTSGTAPKALNSLAAAVPGNVNFTVATNSQGFAWDGTTARPFFPHEFYCVDQIAPGVKIPVPFASIQGHAYDCYAELDKAATVNLTKQVVHGPSTWEYEFGLDNSTDLNGDTNKFNDVDDAYRYPTDASPSVAWTEVIKPGAEYSVTEYGESNGNSPNWVDVDCGDGTGTFTADPGETIACTATNYGNIPLTIDKRADGGDGTFEYTLTHETEGFNTLSITTSGGSSGGIGEGSAGFGMYYEGDYTLTETDQDGWTEGPIECTVHHADDSTTTSTGGFSVVKSDSVECFVINQRPRDVTLTKTVTGDTTPQPGGTTQYTMVVTNHGQYWATFLALVDDMPDHLVPTSTPTAGCTIKGQVLTCKLAPIAPGASATVVVNVQVAADAAVPVSLENTAVLYSIAVEALGPDQLTSSNASIPDTGSDTLTLMALAFAALGTGVALRWFGRRTILR